MGIDSVPLKTWDCRTKGFVSCMYLLSLRRRWEFKKAHLSIASNTFSKSIWASYIERCILVIFIIGHSVCMWSTVLYPLRKPDCLTSWNASCLVEILVVTISIRSLHTCEISDMGYSFGSLACLLSSKEQHSRFARNSVCFLCPSVHLVILLDTIIFSSGPLLSSLWLSHPDQVIYCFHMLQCLLYLELAYWWWFCCIMLGEFCPLVI